MGKRKGNRKVRYDRRIPLTNYFILVLLLSFHLIFIFLFIFIYMFIFIFIFSSFFLFLNEGSSLSTFDSPGFPIRFIMKK